MSETSDNSSVTGTESEQQKQEAYIEALYPQDSDLERVKASLEEHGIYDMSVAPGYGRLLTMLVRLSGTKKVLEIGALGGYSGICLARGLPSDGKLLSLELKQELAELAHNNLRAAGLGAQVEYRVGEALPHLQQLVEANAKFGFFFIDADKGNYPNYLELAIQLSEPGAIIIGDNTFLRGRTLKNSDKGSSAKRVRRFNEIIAQDPRLESTIIPAYDGLAIARVKG